MAARRRKRRQTTPAHRPVDEFANRLGHSFARTELLEQALTHGSYRNHFAVPDYERLEFLGDAALGLVVTEAMHRQRPDWSRQRRQETKGALVSNQSLAEAARALSLEKGIRVGRGTDSDDRVRSSDRILANVFEAVLGAAYLDRGLPASRGIISAAFAARLGPLGLEPLPASPGAPGRLWKRLRTLPVRLRRALRYLLFLRSRTERALGHTFARPALLRAARGGDPGSYSGARRRGRNGRGRNGRGDGRGRDGRRRGRGRDPRGAAGRGRRGRGGPPPGRRNGPPPETAAEEAAAVAALRFLGRDVMQLAAAERLHTRFPDWDEGHLTLARMRLQEKEFWTGLATRWQLGSDETAPGAAEAVLGALYLDGRLAGARRALAGPFAEAVESLDDPNLELLDPKTLLQNRLAKAGRDSPRYEVVETRGSGRVSVTLRLEGGIEETGRGQGIKEAEKDAARRVLGRLYGRARRTPRPKPERPPPERSDRSDRRDRAERSDRRDREARRVPAANGPRAGDDRGGAVTDPHPKNRLHETVLGRDGQPPEYRVLSESGPDHDKTYVVEVFAGDRALGRGTGGSRKKAETAAAEAALRAGANGTAPPPDNPKGALQEAVVQQERRLPVYRLVSESGPEHDRTYVVEVFAGNRSLARGEGGSRKKAESAAAAAALAGGLGPTR